MEGNGQNAAAVDFQCGYCRRKFTKKEHLKRHERAHTGSKPFLCTTCQKRFSRGDVLNRHVKGHRGPVRSAGDDVLQVQANSTPASNLDVAPSAFALIGHSASPTTSDAGNAHGVSHSEQIPMRSVIQPDEHFTQSHLSSSLLWPDSAELYESLISAEGMSWGQGIPVLTPGPEVILGSECNGGNVSADQTGDDELAAAQDGHRAVHAINGLLTKTLFNVTSHVELSDLTPRFLDSSLHMFFTKFVPIFPVFHRPTFVFRNCSAPLLLNAIALGSLFLGTNAATMKGEALWRLAYAAIATSWSEMIHHKREIDSCSGVELVQTALLSQVYAAMSKDRTLRMTSQTFYGLSMHWAQYCGMYDMCLGQSNVVQLLQGPQTYETKLKAWRVWAARETRLRTLLGLCVIDGVVSQFSGNLVNTWPATNSLPLAADDEVFSADTPDKWFQVMVARCEGSERSLSRRIPDIFHSLVAENSQLSEECRVPGLLNIKIFLEMLASLTSELARDTQPRTGVQTKLEPFKALCTLRRQISQSHELTTTEKAIGLLRWHAVCLDLVVSTARGARRMCHHYGITQHIFGGNKRDEPIQINPEAWAQGPRARKCLLHALEIHKLASDVPLGYIHDTSLPGALFAAATTYCSFALPGASKVLVPALIDWDVVVSHGLEDVAGMPAIPPSARGNSTLAFLKNNADLQMADWVPRNLVYEMSSVRILLHSLSKYWGVTEEMEEVVRAWEARCS